MDADDVRFDSPVDYITGRFGSKSETVKVTVEVAAYKALAESHAELMAALGAEAARLLRMQTSLMATSEVALAKARKL